MPTTTSPTDGSFVVRYLSVVCSGLFVGFRPLPVIPPIFLRNLFWVGVGAFVGYLAVEPGLRNKYSLGYLVPVDNFYTVTDISIRSNLL